MIIIVSCRIWELLTDNERWRAVLEVMLRKAAHALAVVRGVRDPSAEGTGTTTSDSWHWPPR